MTPASIASSSVRYSLTETLSLAARRVKKKSISMDDEDSAEGGILFDPPPRDVRKETIDGPVRALPQLQRQLRRGDALLREDARRQDRDVDDLRRGAADARPAGAERRRGQAHHAYVDDARRRSHHGLGHAARHAVRGHERHHGVAGLHRCRQGQGDLRGALGRRQGDDALPEDVLGRRLRHVHRQVRHAVDGQRRRRRRRGQEIALQTPSPRDDPRAFLRALFDAAVAQALPGASLAAFLPSPPRGRTLVLGAGKAGGAMAAALDAAWPAEAPMVGLVVTRYDSVPPAFAAAQARGTTRIEVVQAAHPVPDEAGRRAAARILELARGLSADDLVICLMSGGASSLLALPAAGVTLEEKQAINSALLKSGAAIGEMNCVRKHLSAIKGGRLAAACAPAR